MTRPLFLKPNVKAQPASNEPASSKLSVLLIDDEPSVLEGLHRILHANRRAWSITTASSGELGLAAIAQQRFDVVVSDMSMSGMHGVGVLKAIQTDFPEVLRIALTGFVDEEWKVKNSSVAQVFLLKPCKSKDLIDAIENPQNFRWTTSGAGDPRQPAEFKCDDAITERRPDRDWNDDQTVEFS